MGVFNNRFTLLFKAERALGVGDTTIDTISVFPNPVGEELHIQSKGILHINRVTIYNVLGEKIIEVSEPKNSISMEQLNFGVHLVVIDTDQGSLHKTILKK